MTLKTPETRTIPKVATTEPVSSSVDADEPRPKFRPIILPTARDDSSVPDADELKRLELVRGNTEAQEELERITQLGIQDLADIQANAELRRQAEEDAELKAQQRAERLEKLQARNIKALKWKQTLITVGILAVILAVICLVVGLVVL